MTKHDWFWVAVKVAGLVLVLYAGAALLAIVTTLFGLSTELSGRGFGSILLALVLNVSLVGVVGLWLIWDGSLLLRWAADGPDAPSRR